MHELRVKRGYLYQGRLAPPESVRTSCHACLYVLVATPQFPHYGVWSFAFIRPFWHLAHLLELMRQGAAHPSRTRDSFAPRALASFILVELPAAQHPEQASQRLLTALVRRRHACVCV